MPAITEDQLTFFKVNGYLIIRSPLSAAQQTDIITWSQELHDRPNEAGTVMPYLEISSAGLPIVSRVENYANYHGGFNQLLRGDVLSVLAALSGEEMILMKEKINFKLPGAGGFAPHIDAVAYTSVKALDHLTILMAVEPANMDNGCLQVVAGSHLLHIPLGEDRCITPAWCDSQSWIPVELNTGDFLVFGSKLAHKSEANHSPKGRAAIYATYNRASEGDLHDAYYANRRKLWPATFERKEGETYEEGAVLYGFGSPMLTIQGITNVVRS